MISKTNSQFTTNDTYFADFLIELAEYESLKTRITDQYLKNIEIPGFRKGMAPKDKLMQKADLDYLQNLIINDTITRNYPSASQIMDTEIKENKRSTINITLSTEEGTLAETETGFKFRLVAILSPDIDLEKISNITIKKADSSLVKTEMSQEKYLESNQNSFLQTLNQYEDITDSSVGLNSQNVAISDIIETNLTLKTDPLENKDVMIHVGTSQLPKEFDEKVIGMKTGENQKFEIKIKNNLGEEVSLKFDVTVKALKSPKYKTLEEIFANDEKIKESFVSVESFVSNLKKDYNQRIESELKAIDQRNAVLETVKTYSDLAVDTTEVDSEVSRLMGLYSNEKDPVLAFNSGNFLHTQIATTETLEKSIRDYVTGEFRFSKICFAIYLTKITEKPNDQEIASYAKEIGQNPKQYGYPESLTSDELKDRIFDNILKNKSIEWILNTIKII
jgi:FKBP-type peptidyl-prolyl cis-trans isomerase (trigger factor)